MNKQLIPKIKDNNKYYFSDLNEWYNHYKSELKLLYNNFIWICFPLIFFTIFSGTSGVTTLSFSPCIKIKGLFHLNSLFKILFFLPSTMYFFFIR